MKTVWARLSQPAILPCDLSPADGEEAAANLLLEWRRNGSLIFNAFGQEPGFSSAEYQGRLGRAGNLGMTIHSVKADDQDLYRCSVTRFAKSTNGGEKEHGKLMRLVVHSHPRITDPTDGEEFFVRPNGTANLECQAEGIPTPSVRWKRKMQSGRLVTVQEGPSLRVDKFTEEMEGDYICEADNFEGRATAVLRLRTRRPLRIDRQNASLVNKTAVEGASVFWHCAVEEPGGWRQNQQPQVQIRWSRNEQPISGSAVGLRAHLKDGEFGILRLRRDDSGPYACEASSSREADGFFEHDRVVVQLDVQYKPEISTAKTRRFHTLVSGARAELDCFVQANPVPTIVKWTKNGREMHGHQEQLVGDGSLLLSRVPIGAASLPADAGIYTCEAENSVGASAAFEIHVVVADGPKFTKMPAPVYRVNAGHRLEVPCEGFAEVPLRKLWTKNGEPFEVADSKFVLESASHDHHGVYRCILVNSVVSVFKEFQIFVEETWPQCAAQVRVECLGPRAGFSLSWVPGYPGGNVTQLFRIFYRKSQNNMDKEEEENEQQGWMATDFTNHAGLRLEGLEEFGEYEMKLEAGNKFGSVNCSLPARHHTCSKLSTPANFHLDWMDGEAQRRPILLWDRVAEAGKYKVKYRRNGRRGGDNAFRELAELTGTQFPLPLQRLNLNESGAASGGAEFVVQAVRAPFLSSEPTEAISFPPAGNAQNSAALAFGLVATGGLISALFFVLLLIFVKKHSKGRRNIFVEKADTQQQQQGNCHVVLNGIEKHHPHLQHGFSPNSHNNSSHFPSSSTLTSFQQLQLQQQQHYSRFGRHPVAITRKLFPDNYICTKLAQFDEEEEEVEGELMVEEEAARRQSFEQYGQFPSCENGSFLLGNGSSVSANFTAEMQSEPADWHAECHRGGGVENGGIASKSASYMEMRTAAAGEERRSAVDEMLREKYIFDQTETLDRMDELRIEQLRRELMGKYGNDNDNVV